MFLLNLEPAHVSLPLTKENPATLHSPFQTSLSRISPFSACIGSSTINLQLSDVHFNRQFITETYTCCLKHLQISYCRPSVTTTHQISPNVSSSWSPNSTSMVRSNRTINGVSYLHAIYRGLLHPFCRLLTKIGVRPGLIKELVIQDTTMLYLDLLYLFNQRLKFTQWCKRGCHTATSVQLYGSTHGKKYESGLKFE